MLICQGLNGRKLRQRRSYVILLRTRLDADNAAYGAILATLSLVTGWQSRRRTMKVSLSYGLYGSPGSWVSATQLVYSAVNTGGTSVRITSVGLKLPHGDKLVPVNYQGGPLPNTVLPGHNVEIYEDVAQVQTTLRKEGLTGEVKVQAVFNDATGKAYTSKKMKLSV